MSATLLHYRPWRGQFRSTASSPWPIARVALSMMFRRKIFWALYAFALLSFLVLFFGQYLMAWAAAQDTGQPINIMKGVPPVTVSEVLFRLREGLHLDGTAQSYLYFFNYQAYMVMIVLALAGTILVGNDFQYGSLSFYLSKPLAPRHYLIGKCLAVAVFVNLMTTIPAVILFVQYRMLYDWNNLWGDLRLLAGILAYGLVLTVFLSLLLVATASGLRRVVPLIMAWTTLFLLIRLLATSFVWGLGWDAKWRLVDLWTDTYVIGCALLGADSPAYNPEWPEAAAVLLLVCTLCLRYLSLRIRGVEVVR